MVLYRGELNLKILWERYKHLTDCHSSKQEVAVKKVTALVIGGVFLFTTKNYRLSLRHATLLLSAMRRAKSLVQPILALLFEGLSSFVRGGDFFGSPYSKAG